VPLSPPLDVAATVMVCPVPPVVAAMLAAPPVVCPDIVGGIRVSVFGPEVATVTDALGATGGVTSALVDATGSVDATGAMLTGIAMP